MKLHGNRLPIALLLVWPVAAGAQPPRPEPGIQAALDATAAAVALLQDQLRADSCLSFALVGQHMRGSFNLHRASRAILGRNHWPEDPATQERFVDTFARFLIVRYGELIPDFNANTLKLDPWPEGQPDNQLTIDAQMTFNDGEKVWAGLAMLYEDGRWGIYDILADDFSFGRSLRDEFLYEVAVVGVEGLIAQLEEQVALDAPECDLQAQVPVSVP